MNRTFQRIFFLVMVFGVKALKGGIGKSFGAKIAPFWSNLTPKRCYALEIL